MTAPSVVEYDLYGLDPHGECGEFCVATHKPGLCKGQKQGQPTPPAPTRVDVPAAPAPLDLAKRQRDQQTLALAHQRAQRIALALGLHGGGHQSAVADLGHSIHRQMQTARREDVAHTRLQQAHDSAVVRAAHQAAVAAHAAARQQVAAQRAALRVHARRHGLRQHSLGDASLVFELYGLPVQPEHDLYEFAAGGHELCWVGEFCRNPLHPGPCKGWKHMLHSVSPGTYHALEQSRVAKLNAKRKARIAELQAQGKPVPKYLLKEITYAQAPKAPGDPYHYKPPTPEGEKAILAKTTNTEIKAKVAGKIQAKKEAKAEEQYTALGKVAATLGLEKQLESPQVKDKFMGAVTAPDVNKPSDAPVVKATIDKLAQAYVAKHGAHLGKAGGHQTKALNAVTAEMTAAVDEGHGEPGPKMKALALTKPKAKVPTDQELNDALKAKTEEKLTGKGIDYVTTPSGQKIQKINLPEAGPVKAPPTPEQPELTPKQQALAKTAEKIGAPITLAGQVLTLKPDEVASMPSDLKVTVTKQLADAADAAVSSMAKEHLNAALTHLGVAKPVAKSAPPAPAVALPEHVQHAQALATGATFGTAKTKVAAYDKLTPEQFHSLPADVQKKVIADLNEAHDKFLDPAKKQSAQQVLTKLGPPGDAMVGKPPGVGLEAGEAFMAADKLTGGFWKKNLVEDAKQAAAGLDIASEKNGLDKTVQGFAKGMAAHLSIKVKEAVPNLDPDVVNKIEDKVAGEIEQVLKNGAHNSASFPTAQKVDSILTSPLTTGQKIPYLENLVGGPTATPPPPAPVQLAGDALAAHHLKGSKAAHELAGNEATPEKLAQAEAAFKQAVNNGTLDSVISGSATAAGYHWATKHVNGLPLTEAQKQAIRVKAKADFTEMIKSGATHPKLGSVLDEARLADEAGLSPQMKASRLLKAAGIPTSGAGAGGIAAPTSSATPLAKTALGKAPGLGKAVSITGISKAKKSVVFSAFKSIPPGNVLSSPPEQVFDNLIAVATHYSASADYAGSLSPLQVMKIVDAELSAHLGKENASLLEKRMTDWLGTPAGKTYAYANKSAKPEIITLLGGNPAAAGTAIGYHLKPGQKVQEVTGGPGKYDPAVPASQFHKITGPSMQKSQDLYVASTGTKWTSAQKQALSTYTTGSYYSINGYLRDKEDASALTKQQVLDMQAGMRPIQQDVLGLRGTGWEQLPVGYRSAAEAVKLVGKTITEPAFMSTSVAGSGGQFSGALRLEVEIPKGSMVAYLHSISHNKSENELLLAAGTKFHVISVTPDDHYPYGVRMRIRVIS